MAIYMNQHNVRKLVRLLTMQPPLIVGWYADHFALDSWADSISLPTNKHFQELSIKGCDMGGGGEYSVIMFFLFLPSLPRSPFFVSILAQYDDRKKSCIWDYFLPTSSLVPFNYCFSFQTKSKPWIEFRKNLSKCVIWGALNPDNILKIDTFYPFKVPRIPLNLW